MLMPALSNGVALSAMQTVRRSGRPPRATRAIHPHRLGGRAAVDAAAASLPRLRDRVDPAGVGEPKRLVVLTAAGYAYERTDGVAVAPITCLGP